jgi:hypothetical protein
MRKRTTPSTTRKLTMLGRYCLTRASLRAAALAVALGIAGWLGAAGSASAQNLVTNPNFDSGLDGYSANGFVGVYGYYSPTNALLCASSCGYSTLATLTQSIVTTPGTSYMVSFLASFYPGNYTASFGTGSFSHQGTSQDITTAFPFSFTGTATGTSTDLTFTSDGAIALDNLDVESAPAPIPGGGGLSVIAGLGGLGWLAVRRARQDRTAPVA